MKINYLVPTWDRAESITTLKYLDKARAIVAPEQYDDYVRHNPEIDPKRFIVAPDGVQGHGKSKCLNWMLDTQWEGYDAIVHIDDDIVTYMRHLKLDTGTRYIEYEPIGQEDFYEIAENACGMAYDWGCGMWGLSINVDPLSYAEFMPFRTLGYIDGGTVGYVRDDGIRYDEQLTVKEDVDFFLQQIQRYHKALRIEKYCIKKGSFTNEGGNQGFRTPELEQKQFQEMQRKWGSNVIRPNAAVAKNKSKIRGYGGAIRLNLPYEGV